MCPPPLPCTQAEHCRLQSSPVYPRSHLQVPSGMQAPDSKVIDNKHPTEIGA